MKLADLTRDNRLVVQRAIKQHRRGVIDQQEAITAVCVDVGCTVKQAEGLLEEARLTMPKDRTISGRLMIGALLLLTYPCLVLGPLTVQPGLKESALLRVAQIGFLFYPVLYFGSLVAVSIVRSKEIAVSIASAPLWIYALACLLLVGWLSR
jgi:hypothetical protein